MLKSQLLASISIAMGVGAFAQSPATDAHAVSDPNGQEAAAVRALLTYAFEES